MIFGGVIMKKPVIFLVTTMLFSTQLLAPITSLAVEKNQTDAENADTRMMEEGKANTGLPIEGQAQIAAKSNKSLDNKEAVATQSINDTVTITTNFAEKQYINTILTMTISIDEKNTIKSGDQLIFSMPSNLKLDQIITNGLLEQYGHVVIDQTQRTYTIVFDRDMTGIQDTSIIINIPTPTTPNSTGTITGSYLTAIGETSELVIPNNTYTISPWDPEDRSKWIVGGDSGTITNHKEEFDDNCLASGSHTYLPNQNSMTFFVYIDPSGEQKNLTGRKITIIPYKDGVPDTTTGAPVGTGAGSYIDVNDIWISNGPLEASPTSTKLVNSKWPYTVNSDGSISIQIPDGEEYTHYAVTMRIKQDDFTQQARGYVIATATGNSTGGAVITEQKFGDLWGTYQTTGSKGFIPNISSENKIAKINETTINTETTWLLNGVTAKDVEDGDLSSSVVVADDGGFKEAWSNKRPGVYTVTYAVTDKDGNRVTETATVTLYSDITVYYKDTQGQTIKAPTTLAGEVGEAYSVDKGPLILEGKNYEFVSSSPETTTGNFGQNAQPTEITLTYTWNQQAINAGDYTMYLGDSAPKAADFQATATDKAGQSLEVSVDLSQANLAEIGVYPVTLSTLDGQTKTVSLTVAENRESLSAENYTMYVGDQIPTAENFKAQATDKAGNPAVVNVDLGQTDTKIPGTYPVTITTAGGKSQVVQLIVLKNQQTLKGADYTMYLGDAQPTVANFQASATDKTGALIGVTVDLSQVNLNKVGTYPVRLISADGQDKTVKLTVKSHNSVTSQDLSKPSDPKTGQSSNRSISSTLPNTGENMQNWWLILGNSLVTLAVGVLTWKKRIRKR